MITLIAFGVRYIPDEKSMEPKHDVPAVTQTPTTTLSQTSESATVEKEVGSNTEQDSTTEKSILEPNIITTPYSVYIGFATDVGTSSEEVLQQEVGEVVVGYEWEVLFRSPMFSTVVLPAWDLSNEGQQKEYTVQVWDEDSYMLLGNYTSFEEIKFPREGLRGASRFKVTGIDPALRICPGDRSFIWDVRFTFEGQLGLIRTPITQDLPQGETCRIR